MRVGTPLKIAILWQSSTPVDEVTDTLAGASRAARICVFADAVAEGDAIRRFRPLLLVLVIDSPGAEDVGSLRLLCRMLTKTSTIVVTTTAHAAAGGELARRLQVRCVSWPADRNALIDALEAARGTVASSEPQALLNLTLGISDEVNNPLQTALGHLRLLESELARDEPKLLRVRAATRSLRRIQATLDRARQLQRATELSTLLLPVDLGAILGDLMPGREFAPTVVSGDRDLLATAIADLGAVGRDLAPDNHPPTFTLAQENGAAVVRLRLASSRLADWQLPRTFEPYYLSRLLRGTSHGLKLFGVHHIVEAHGGTARARRHADGGLVFELTLPGVEVPERDPDQGQGRAGDLPI